jgi:uncharacterized repeat protein (TIGR01451 family)
MRTVRHPFKISLLCVALLSWAGVAQADGIYMTNMKTKLTQSSIDLLTDPARVNPSVQSGDIVEYVLQAQVANAAGGPGVYFTAYIPNGVEVLGAWFVTDATGATVRSPGSGGHANDGWGLRGSKMPFGAPFVGVLNSRQNDLSGDTGIFYSTDLRTQLFTADNSGIAKGPTANPTATSGTSNGYNVTDTFYKGVDAFNLWDADQVNAFGAGGVLGSVPVNIAPTSTAKVINSVGQGSTPFGSGSPLAGPQTGYTLDNTGQVGPWQRIQYPGSQIANIADGAATAIGTADSPTVLTTTAGAGLSDGSPLPATTNAVRWSYGMGMLNDPVYVKVRVRVNATAIAAPTQTLLNFEANGTDNWGSGSKDNPWRYFGPTVAQSGNLFLVKEIAQVNGTPYLGGTIVPGATVTYRIRYLNLGNLPVKGVTFSDKLAAAIATTGCNGAIPTFSGLSNGVTATVSGGSLACPSSAATVTFSNLPNVIGGSLGALRGGSFTYNVKISPTVADNATVANTATFSAQDAATSTLVSTTSTAQFIANKTPTIIPDLTLTKIHSGSFSVGTAAAYQFTLKNIGNLATNGSMTVKDALPKGLTIPDGAVSVTGVNSANWSCTALGNVITCTSSVSIAAGGGMSMFQINGIQVSSAAVPSVTNQATVSGGGETNTTNNTASDLALVKEVPDLTVTKQSVGSLTVGKTATYAFTVKNIGKGATTGPMTTSDLLPLGLTVPDGPIAVTGTNAADWTCASLGGDVDCTSSVSIPGNSSSTFTISSIQINSAALPAVTNGVTIVGGGETNLTNNGSSDTTTVSPAPAPICNLGGGTADPAIGAYISPEVDGTTAASRTAVDGLDDAWRSAAGLPQTGTVQPWFGTTVGSIPNNAPNLFTTNGVNVDVALVNLDNPTTNCTGTINAGAGTPQLTQAAALQDTAPRPASLFDSAGNHPSYWTENVGSTTSRNGILFTFSKPVAAFGAWFGDVETRADGNGTPALLRLLDANGQRIGQDIPITPTTISNGGAFASVDQAQCGTSFTDRGCGNKSTRWIGFVDGMARVKQALVIVGDDDFGDVGDTEHMSFIGANLVPAIASSPKVLLVKRITAINDNRITNLNDSTPLGLVIDDITSPKSADDNHANWLSGYLKGAIDAGKVNPGDKVEYTVYFISVGGAPVKNLNICDLVPGNMTFFPDGFGSDRGIQLSIGSTLTTLTNVPDDDRAEYFVPNSTPSINCSGTNTNGAVLVKVVDGTVQLPNAVTPGTPGDSYGFIRFRVKAN